MNTTELKKIYNNTKSFSILFNKLNNEKDVTIKDVIYDTLIDLHSRYIDDKFKTITSDLDKLIAFKLTLDNVAKMFFTDINFMLEYCTYNTVELYCEKLINDAYEAEISFKKANNYNDITLNENEKLSIKSKIISNICKMLFRYADSSDILTKFEVNKTQKGVAGHIEFIRNNKVYYLNTDTIYASGDVQRLHARYIVRSTNAPYINESDYKKSIEKITKIDRLLEYVNNPRLTKEGSNIKTDEFMINKNNEDIEFIKNKPIENSLYNNSKMYRITKVNKLPTEEFLCHVIDNPTNYIEMLIDLFGFEYDGAKKYHDDIRMKYEKMREEYYTKYEGNKPSSPDEEFERRLEFFNIENMMNLELSDYVEKAIPMLFTDKAKKGIMKQREREIKSIEKDTLKRQEKIKLNQVLIDEKVEEYYNLISE